MSRFVKLTLSALFLSQFLCAQFGSGIQGTIVDRTSAVMPGVRIMVTNADTGVSREAVSDHDGVLAVRSEQREGVLEDRRLGLADAELAGDGNDIEIAVQARCGELLAL